MPVGAVARDPARRSAISIPLTLLIRALAQRLGVWGVDPTVYWTHTVVYTLTVSWAALPIYLYAALRRYLQAMGRVMPVMFALDQRPTRSTCWPTGC